mmetsp:Transcript_66944/g.160319  ORF Transcript_66944/g.160319 Transcript_66944/m.160319 type:complete len:600 (+) Transcript_66944:88-1887(+)
MDGQSYQGNVYGGGGGQGGCWDNNYQWSNDGYKGNNGSGDGSVQQVAIMPYPGYGPCTYMDNGYVGGNYSGNGYGGGGCGYQQGSYCSGGGGGGYAYDGSGDGGCCSSGGGGGGGFQGGGQWGYAGGEFSGGYYPRYNQGSGPVYDQDLLQSFDYGAGDQAVAQVPITVTGKQGEEVPRAISTFEECDQIFPPVIMNKMRSSGFSSPTPIQANTWAIALKGRDVIGVAKTGSGKTLAFLIPGFMKIMQGPGMRISCQLLALAPTRELAKQIEEQAQKFGLPCSIKTACLYGGAPRGPQLGQLRRGVQVVVATPGRLNDFLESNQVDLSPCQYLVLDEADRMLDMGFEPQIRTIIARLPTSRQTLLYSATWGQEVRSLASDFLTSPISVTVGNQKLVANDDVQQHAIIVRSDQDKLEELRKILEQCVQGDLVLIFCDTKVGCAWLGEHLYSQYRIPCTALHGDLAQRERDFAIRDFKSGRRPVMVGTNVAARGLDIKGIKVVINFDPASDPEDYIHRIGRTGRAGEKGLAYSLLMPNDHKKAWDIVQVMQAGSVPVPQELLDLAGVGQRGRGGKKGKGGKGMRKGKGKGWGGGYGRGKGK